MMASSPQPPSPLLTGIDESLLGHILSTYLDFKSLVTFTVAIAGSSRNWHPGSGASKQATSLMPQDGHGTAMDPRVQTYISPPFVFPRLSLNKVTMNVFEMNKVAQSSLALVRRFYRIKGIEFNLQWNPLSAPGVVGTQEGENSSDSESSSMVHDATASSPPHSISASPVPSSFSDRSSTLASTPPALWEPMPMFGSPLRGFVVTPQSSRRPSSSVGGQTPSFGVSSVTMVNNSVELSRKSVIRRIPFIIAPMEDVEFVTFHMSMNSQDESETSRSVSQYLTILFRGLAQVFQAGFSTKIERIKVPELTSSVMGSERTRSTNPNLLRLLVDAAMDEFLPEGYHPLSIDNFLGQNERREEMYGRSGVGGSVGGIVGASLSLALRPRSDDSWVVEERDLHDSIEALFYQLPTANARRFFAKQLLVGL